MHSAVNRLLEQRLFEIGVGVVVFAGVLVLLITFGSDPDDAWSPLYVVLVSAVALVGLGLCVKSRRRTR